MFTHFVLCCAIVLFLFYRSWIPFVTAIIALGFESFIAYDFFGLTYLYVLPLFFLTSFLQHYLSLQLMPAYLSLLIMLAGHTFFTLLFELNSYPLGVYTLLQIGANLSLMYISLKWLATAKRGNRF